MIRILAAACCLSLAALPALAADQASYDAALKAAQAAEKQAGALDARWTTTEETLQEAEKAAAAQDYAKATALAQHAEALAKASIVQANEQKTAWRAAVIR